MLTSCSNRVLVNDPIEQKEFLVERIFDDFNHKSQEHICILTNAE